MLQRRCKLRIPRRVRLVQPDHADGRAGEGQLERPRVKVRRLLRREQREPPAAGHDASDVFAEVEVRLYRQAIADPDARHDGGIDQVEDVLGCEARQELRNGRRLDVDRRRTVLPAKLQDAVGGIADRLRPAVEIERSL